MSYLDQTGSVTDDEKLHIFLISQSVQPSLQGDLLTNVLSEIFNEGAFHKILLLFLSINKTITFELIANIIMIL